jgi:hypothetical protein
MARAPGAGEAGEPAPLAAGERAAGDAAAEHEALLGGRDEEEVVDALLGFVGEAAFAVLAEEGEFLSLEDAGDEAGEVGSLFGAESGVAEVHHGLVLFGTGSGSGCARSGRCGDQPGASWSRQP